MCIAALLLILVNLNAPLSSVTIRADCRCANDRKWLSGYRFWFVGLYHLAAHARFAETDEAVV